MLQSRLRGYTMIEVLVVVAILAVLARIALPAYNTYRNKGYMAEAFALLQPFQKRVEERCSLDIGGGNYDVFGTGSAGGLTDAAGNTINFANLSKALGGVQWFYTTSGSPPLFSTTI